MRLLLLRKGILEPPFNLDVNVPQTRVLRATEAGFYTRFLSGLVAGFQAAALAFPVVEGLLADAVLTDDVVGPSVSLGFLEDLGFGVAFPFPGFVLKDGRFGSWSVEDGSGEWSCSRGQGQRSTPRTVGQLPHMLSGFPLTVTGIDFISCIISQRCLTTW